MRHEAGTRPEQRQQDFDFPEREALREEWMRAQVERLPLSDSAKELLVVIGSHAMATREGETIRLQHESASSKVIADCLDLSERHVRNLRRELRAYHEVLSVTTFRTKRPPEWTIAMGVLIDAPPAVDPPNTPVSREHPGQLKLFADPGDTPSHESAKPPGPSNLIGRFLTAVVAIVSPPTSGTRSGNAAPERKSSGTPASSAPTSIPLKTQCEPPTSGTLPDSPHTQSTCVGESNQRSTPARARGLSKKFSWGRDIEADELRDGARLQALWEHAVKHGAPFIGKASDLDRMAFFGFARYSCAKEIANPGAFFNAGLRGVDKFGKSWRTKIRIDDEEWARRIIHELDYGRDDSDPPVEHDHPADHIKRALAPLDVTTILKAARQRVSRDSDLYTEFARVLQDRGLDAIDDDLLKLVFAPT